MSDGDAGAPFHQTVELLLDRRFDLRIERRGRLVEDEDRRILQDHAGDGDALALSARELDPALADMRVEAAPSLPVLQSLDEVERVGARRGIADLGLAGLRPAIAYVVADRAVEQRRVLRHHGDAGTQALLRDAGDVLAV